MPLLAEGHSGDREWTLALLAVLVLVAGPRVAVGDSWHRAYERGQRDLVEGRAAEAEAAFVQALALRSKPGCRLRTYGVKVRDYTPWYYLGVALADQGRSSEAREAFERAVAEGVVQDCPGTRLQALDLLDRLDRFDAGPSQSTTGTRDSATLREAALASDAERFASAEVAAARAEELACASCPATASAWLEALSRARVDGPILLLLERSAREALLAAELALRRESSPGAGALEALERSRALLPAASTSSEWLEVESEAERALELAGPTGTKAGAGASPLPSPPPLAVALREAIARAEAAAISSSRLGEGPRTRAATQDLARARRLSQSSASGDLEEGLRLSERARAAFVRERGQEGPAGAKKVRPALIELTRSEKARVSRPALLPAGEGP